MPTLYPTTKPKGAGFVPMVTIRGDKGGRMLGSVTYRGEPRGEFVALAEAVNVATRMARTEGFAAAGESIVVAAGVPFGQSGTTNALRVVAVR